MPYNLDGKFEGCIEFFSLEEWPELPLMVKKLTEYVNEMSTKELNYTYLYRVDI